MESFEKQQQVKSSKREHSKRWFVGGEEYYLHQAVEAIELYRAAEEGEKLALKSDKTSGTRSDYNPRILDTQSGARDRIIAWVGSFGKKYPELKDLALYAKLHRLAQILKDYNREEKFEPGQSVSVPYDIYDAQRQHDIAEILDDPKVEKILDAIAADLKLEDERKMHQRR